MNRLLFILASGLTLAALGCASAVQGTMHQASLEPAQQVAGARVADAGGQPQEITLAGNVHPLARAEFDAGPVAAETRMERMLLLLKPTAAQQAELDALVEAQQDRSSPRYQQWLTPAEYGVRFGASSEDRARVTAWLAAQGFQVDEIAAGNRLVIFSGTAAQVDDAFHTEMRNYRVAGASHVANAEDPQIPSALSAVVGGVVSLNDFRRQSQMRAPVEAGVSSEPRALYSAGSTHYLFPADVAAIYDLAPLYAAGTVGSGASIAIAGRSNINLSDVAAFRSLAGLTAKTPAVIVAGSNPGLVTGDQDEATLDVEWAGAVAPAADVSLVTAASTATTDGIDLSAQYAVNHRTAQVVSVSYGSCEQAMGAAELAFYHALWQQAASEGISVFVASGDAGAGGCQVASAASATQRAVNGMCSSPYATCVGGTEFSEGAHPEQYWATGNSANYGSALGYIPEAVWNESLANGGTGLWASGGGASTVYTQPSWQAAVTGASAAGGMRAVPDVALSAANHDGYMIVEKGSNWIVSGTSASTPAFAGVMALIVGKLGGVGQGSANARLYALANAGSNVFHATASGSNTVPGVTGFWANGATYNLATGLGSVDGAALLASWGTGVTQPPVLTLSAGSSSISVVQGGSATVSFTVAASGSFTGNVSLSVSGLPSGLTAAWSANTISFAGGTGTTVVTLNVAAAAGASTGSSAFSVTASGDGVSSAQSVAVAVRQPRLCLAGMRPLQARCGAPAPVLPPRARLLPGGVSSN